MFRNIVIVINDVIVILFMRFVLFLIIYTYHAIFLRFVIKKCRLMRFNIVLTYFFNLYTLNQNLLLLLQWIINLSTFFRRKCKHLLFVFCFQFVSLHLKYNSEIIFNFNVFFCYFHFMHANSKQIRVLKFQCLRFYSCVFNN